MNRFHRYCRTGALLAVAAFAGLAAFDRPAYAGPQQQPAVSNAAPNAIDASVNSTYNWIKEALDQLGVQPDAAPGDGALPSISDGTTRTACTLSLVTPDGVIEGGVRTPGSEGTIAIYNFAHEIVSPRDHVSGLPKGARVHSPVKITKKFDKATPNLYAAVAASTPITTAILKFYAVTPTGEETNYFTITLSNCRIASIKAGFPNDERLEIVYRRIEWTWTDGGITASDEWPAGK